MKKQYKKYSETTKSIQWWNMFLFSQFSKGLFFNNRNLLNTCKKILKCNAVGIRENLKNAEILIW